MPRQEILLCDPSGTSLEKTTCTFSEKSKINNKKIQEIKISSKKLKN